MIKMSLLSMVQDIMSDMDSDEVNSIDDTYESMQVATIIKNAYNAMLSSRDWPHLNKLIKLEASLTQDRPTYVKMPSNVKRINFINYDSRKASDGDKRIYKEVKSLLPHEFLSKTNVRDSSKDNVELSIDTNVGVEVPVLNDTAPQYWTSFDDEYIVFDSYDSEVDSTIQTSKCQVSAYVYPDFIIEDSFIPDLPAEAFPALLNKARSQAMLWLKQMTDPISEAERKRQQTWLARNSWSAQPSSRSPDYGRRTRKYGYARTKLDKNSGI